MNCLITMLSTMETSHISTIRRRVKFFQSPGNIKKYIPHIRQKSNIKSESIIFLFFHPSSGKAVNKSIKLFIFGNMM